MLKLTYLGRGSSDCDKILHSYADRPSWLFLVLKIKNFENPRWRRPSSWKIEKSRYLGRGSSEFYEIWQTDSLNTTCPGIDIALEGGFD